MNFRRVIISFIIFIPLAAVLSAADGRDVIQILNRLDRELEGCDSYLSGRRNNIDSLRSSLAKEHSSNERLELLLKLGDSYNAYRIDSALHFYQEGMRESSSLHLDSVTVRFAIRTATYLPLQLFISEAVNLMDSVSSIGIPHGLQIEYYDAQRQMNNYISNIFADYPSIHADHREREAEMQRRLLDVLDKNTPQYKLNLAESYFYERKFPEAKAVLTELLNEINEQNPLYARACHMLADISNADDDYDGHVYFLALSAISDIKCATLEVASLQELGGQLFRHDDIKRSHAYLSQALRNAVDCRVSLRIIQTSKALPLIENAHKAQINAFRRRIFIVIGIMAVLLVALFVTLRMVYHTNRVQRKLAIRLEKANKTKDVYIAQFLNLCSIYMDKLNQFNKLVSRKISAGKGEDLLKLTKSGKFVEEQSKEFYEVFDDAFLNIYPSFVEDVNNLLQPDKRLTLKENEKLNTDLRILALMRLGIEDTSRIAQMLNYSVYTIYTYRNKFKSRAIDRDTFEESVMNIKSVS